MKLILRLGNVAYACVGVWAAAMALGLPVNLDQAVKGGAAFFILNEVIRDLWKERG